MTSKIVEISKSQEEYILIDTNMDLAILPNISVNLLIKGNSLNVNVKVNTDAVVNILAFEANDLCLNIENEGNASFVEIALDKTSSVVNANLNAPNANVDIKCLAIGKASDLSFKQNAIHNAALSTSDVKNYGIAMDKAKVTFDTTGKINKGMSKSKCVQLSRGVIMDDDSSVVSKPILLIDEYDVVANHGAAIGKMADDIMFYLMSRGLTKNASFLLYLDGIISPFIKEIKDAKLQEVVLEKINDLIER